VFRVGASTRRGVRMLEHDGGSWKPSGPTVGEPRFDDGKRVMWK
jgi:hypothetical protein